jgi:hypothetical protein
MPGNTFVMIYSADGMREILIKTDSIWKIEVAYFVPNKNEKGEWAWKEQQYVRCSLARANEEGSEAIRRYTYFIGGEAVPLYSLPDDPIHQVLEDLYKHASKPD